MGIGERWFWRAMIALSIAWVVWAWCAHRPLTPRPTIHTRDGVIVER